MLFRKFSAFRVLVALAIAWVLGCSSDKTPSRDAATQPAIDGSTTSKTPEQAAVEVVRPNPILPESDNWTLEEAVAKLAEEPTRLSAAVRLARLSGLDPFGDDALLPLPLAERLRVASLDESLWALGLQTRDDRILAMPILIDDEGEASYPVEDLEPEFTYLHRSDDVELFPHLLFAYDRMWMLIEGEWISALAVKRPAGLHFEKRSESNRRYIVLLMRPTATTDPSDAPGGNAYVEVARYGWDPFELAFSGPLCDNLPDPPGGQFELDLRSSEALIPVGGVLPEPPKIEPRSDIPKDNRPPPF